jgi:putative ABC transport system permease protein
MSVVLLVSAVLVVRSLQNALTVPLGFDPRHVALVSYNLQLQGYDEARARQFQKRLLDNVRSMPGIESAALIDSLPLTLQWDNSGVLIEGKPIPRASDVPLAVRHRLTLDYFRTARTRLIAGRVFDQNDRQEGRHVAIVNEAFVHQLLPGENPIGRRLSTVLMAPGAKLSEWSRMASITP